MVLLRVDLVTKSVKHHTASGTSSADNPQYLDSLALCAFCRSPGMIESKSDKHTKRCLDAQDEIPLARTEMLRSMFYVLGYECLLCSSHVQPLLYLKVFSLTPRITYRVLNSFSMMRIFSRLKHLRQRYLTAKKPAQPKIFALRNLANKTQSLISGARRLQ